MTTKSLEYFLVVVKHLNISKAAKELFISQPAKEFDERLSIHEVRLVPGNLSSNVIFDCVKPAGFKASDSEITSYLQKRVTEWNPCYRCVIKIEQSYV